MSKGKIVTAVIWIVTLIIAYQFAWGVRTNQYREYATQSLKDVVLGQLIQTRIRLEKSIENDDREELEIIAYRFLEIDSLRQKLGNIYIKNNPGTISVSLSVWTSCGEMLQDISKEDKMGLSDNDVSFLRDLLDLCETYIDVFKPNMQTINEFEYNLRSFENELETLIDKFGGG